MRKKQKRLVALLLSLLMIISLLPTTELTVEAATKPKLSKKSSSIVIGGTSKIKVKNAPKGANITYKSAKKNIATVSKQGNVKGIKSGTTKITVSLKKKSKTTKLTYKVTVKKPTLSKGNLSLKTGQSFQVSVQNKPKKATYTWKSSDPRIASVNNKGTVTAKAQGTAIIKVNVKAAKKIYTLPCNVTVKTSNSNGINPDNPKQDLGVLSSDITGANVNVNEVAIFMLDLQNRNITNNSIYLFKGSRSIGEMHDDGKDGDAVASDGVYSYKTTCYSKTETTEKYKAVCKNSVSNTVELRYFDGISEKDIEAQTEYIDEFKKIEESHISVDGNVDVDAVVQNVYQKALEGKKEGDVLSVSMEENGVLIQFSSGIWYVYQPEQEGIDASGRDVNVSIMTLQPYQSSYSTSDKRKSTEATDDSAVKIAKQFENYIFDRNYDNGEVTLDVIKNFSSNQVVLCHTHGYYNSDLGSMLWLGEKLDSSQLRTGGKYADDYLAGRIVITNDYRAGITGGFVSKYLGNLDNSFIYLGSCLSGKDSRLAQSFLNKNAEAVIANSETIWRGYNCNMMRDVANGLLIYNDNSKQYNTLSEALAYAKNINGDNDYIYYPNNDHAPSTPLIFGDRNYRFTEPSNIEVNLVNLNRNSVSIKEGGTVTLTATITPSNATDKTVTWSSSNTNVATVSNGKVSGISAGTATITATTSNGKTATCTVDVTPTVVEPTGITLDQSNVSIKVGGSVTLTATVSPNNATDKTVTWSSNKTSVATVNNGKVTGVSAGTATITATTSNGKTATCTVDVTPTVVEPTGITLDKSNLTIEKNSTVTLTATVKPDNATDKTITWSSSDTSVATVSSGTITGKAAGTATITAKTNNGKMATCNVTVINSEIAATGISLDRESIKFEIGNRCKLIATVTPSNATDKTVIWSSSNTNVAKVDNGLVTGKAVGTATITAKTSNGKTATCVVNVVEYDLSNYVITDDYVGLSSNNSKTLNVISKSNTSYYLDFVIENNSIVNAEWITEPNALTGKVQSRLKLTAKNPGTTKIIIYQMEGPYPPTYASPANWEISVEVKPPTVIEPAGITLDQSNTSIEIGDTVMLTATVTPSNATDKTLTWNSSNTNVATVSNGKVTGVSAGTATITAKTCNEKIASCILTVTRKEIAISEIHMDISKFVISVGESININTSIKPNNATNKDLVWKSSNLNVAKVENGNVIGVANGSVTITATAKSGASSSVVVIVNGLGGDTQTVYNGQLAYFKGNNSNIVSNNFEYLDCKRWLQGNGIFECVDIDKNKDIYLAFSCGDSELTLDAYLTLYIYDANKGGEPVAVKTYQNPQWTNGDVKHCFKAYFTYYPISSLLSDLSGEYQIFYEIRLANDFIIHNSFTNYDDSFYIRLK